MSVVIQWSFFYVKIKRIKYIIFQVIIEKYLKKIKKNSKYIIFLINYKFL